MSIDEQTRTVVAELVTKYARKRTQELLSDGHYSFDELNAIISSDLAAWINAGLIEYTHPLLATKHIAPDGNMRLYLTQRKR